jgi:hypothetical protein
MIVENRFIIGADVESCWALFIDPNKIKDCIPGCEDIERIDDRNFRSIISAKVGPINVKFKSLTTFKEINPPTYIYAVSKGEDINKAGRFSQKGYLRLKELSEKETEVSYRAEINVAGRISTFGDRVMKGKIREIEELFLDSIRNILEVN